MIHRHKGEDAGTLDFASGLSRDAEFCLLEPQPVEYFAENIWFTAYDARNDIAMMFHLGGDIDDWGLWAEKVYVVLPGGDDVLLAQGDGRLATREAPAGSNLHFHCVEPFRRWRVRYDGRVELNRAADLMRGPARAARRVRADIDLDIVSLTPAWIAGHGSGTAERQMQAQQWGSSHYDQLFRFSGQLRYAGRTWTLGGTGFRDHTVGPRNFAPFGGHVLMSAYFPSGRAAGINTHRTTARDVTMAAGYTISKDGQIHHGTVRSASWLKQVGPPGEPLRFEIETQEGIVTIEGETRRNVWLTLQVPNGIAYGADLTNPDRINVCEAHSRLTWDGEEGFGIVERSALTRHLALPTTST
jgi:hypothetical protein